MDNSKKIENLSNEQHRSTRGRIKDIKVNLIHIQGIIKAA
jgi:hypothetical protein